jgi:hypothetical protein
MKQPTKQMEREYRTVSKHCEWTWRENTKDRQSYLYLAGHRIATIYHYSFKYEAHCPGSLVAYRETLSGAKAAAVAAVKAWVYIAFIESTGSPKDDTK